MTYAVRFRHADPARRDEPAMYSSIEPAARVCVINDVGVLAPRGRVMERLTSDPSDIEAFFDRDDARDHVDGYSVARRCERDHLVADVVPIDAALADLKTGPRNVEAHPGFARPISMAGAYAALTWKECKLLGREVAS